MLGLRMKHWIFCCNVSLASTSCLPLNQHPNFISQTNYFTSHSSPLYTLLLLRTMRSSVGSFWAKKIFWIQKVKELQVNLVSSRSLVLWRTSIFIYRFIQFTSTSSCPGLSLMSNLIYDFIQFRSTSPCPWQLDPPHTAQGSLFAHLIFWYRVQHLLNI